MTVSHNALAAQKLGNFFNFLSIKGLNAWKKMAKKVLTSQGRALELGSNVGSAFESKCFKAAMLTKPEVINFYRTGKSLYLGEIISVFVEVTDYTHCKTIPISVNGK